MTPSLFTAPRFVLILSVQSNLIRAALVIRELRIVASAKQPFQINEGEFDPAEIWYKTKRVIEACLDIGRTLSREIAGIAIVTEEAEEVVWHEQEGEIAAQGRIVSQNVNGIPQGTSQSGTLATWLLWNLTGSVSTSELGKTRVRAPFDTELPIVAVLRAADVEKEISDEPMQDRAVLGAAREAWAIIQK